MTKVDFDISNLADLTQSIANYQDMRSQFPQYGGDCKDNMDAFLEKLKSKEKYWDSPVFKTWNEISIHITFQTWSSTACGWGGIGGSAMTTSMNVIIENMYTGLVFVYWNGRLAYVTHTDNVPDFYKVPSIQSAKDCVYKHAR